MGGARGLRGAISACLGLVITATVGMAAPSGAGTEPSTAERLSLSEAVEQALRGNPLIRSARAGRQMADARLSEARAGWFPTVSFNETFTRGNNPVFVFGSLLEQARFGPDNFAVDALNDPGPLNNFRTALNVRVPLFDQLQAYTGSSQARLAGEQAASQVDLVEQQVRFEVIRAYYGLLVAQARKGVADEAVKMAESDVRRTRDLFQAGLVVQADLLANQVQASDFRQEQIQAAGDLASASAGLNTALGLPTAPRLRLSGELTDRAFVVPAEEELIQDALQNRSDYASASSSVASAQAGVRGATAQYLPRLDAFGTWGGSGRTLGIDSSDYLFGAALTVNLLDLGRGARVSQARAAVTAAEAQRQYAADRIGLEVVQSYNQYVSARERLEVAKGAVEQAAEALRIVRDRYQEGLTTVTEVLRSQTALVRTRMSLLAARYGYYVGYAGLRLAAGTLRDVEAFGP